MRSLTEAAGGGSKDHTPLNLQQRVIQSGMCMSELAVCWFGVGGFDRKLHHEVVKDTDNHYVALTREILPINLFIEILTTI